MKALLAIEYETETLCDHRGFDDGYGDEYGYKIHIIFPFEFEIIQWGFYDSWKVEEAMKKWINDNVWTKE